MDNIFSSAKKLADRVAEEVFASDLGGELNYKTKKVSDNSISFETWNGKKLITIIVKIKNINE